MAGKLTKAQQRMMARVAIAPVRPYHSEWITFYTLCNAGLVDYASDPSGRYDYQTVALTPAGRRSIEENGR